MKKAVRVEIFGTVQGIFFRNFIKESADKLGIKGYVRNREDGSVEAWFEGNSQDVDKMIEICKDGPEHTIIKKIDIVEENFQDLKEFKILKI
ncbi:MAG: acylphosphatase [Candidatus Pacearchaeota archaeon]